MGFQRFEGKLVIVTGAGSGMGAVTARVINAHQVALRLGLVLLPVDRPRRLLALHHRLEAVLNDEGRGCHRHVELGAEGLVRSAEARTAISGFLNT
jgi:NAD(P)-dependent dehydrogenase (short-subunit alcohol dehydrogenase family)